MSPTAAFAPDYATARARFREAVRGLDWRLETHGVGVSGPDGEELTIDVGYCQGCKLDKTLVVSSGVHGVEGFFGSAVQLALLQRWATEPPAGVHCVLLHGLNPYGFAWLRRGDQNNVDLNRNFLLPGEAYEGSPAGYADLDGLLNPQSPPSRWEPFTLKALWAIACNGMQRMRNTVATGQYAFPKGLFYGGAEPSRTHQLLSEHLPRWLQGSQSVAHLDFHTGLGRSATCKLLINYPLSERQRTWLSEWFGADSFESSNRSSIAYDARGEFGRWCVSRKLATHYLFACAEYGTADPVKMLAGLRAENRAYHWGQPSAASTAAAKQQLKELFCPASEAWRTEVLQHGVGLVSRAIQGLRNSDHGRSG